MKFPAFYGTRKIITAFATARHLFLSLDRRILSTPSHPILMCIFILSDHLLLGLQSGFFPSPFPIEILISISLLSSTCHMSRLLHAPWLGHPDSNVLIFGGEDTS